ncbi:prostatic spermine-binding protein-like [Ischnura elegans]|uniref:prostatic spermine-binding protein-like n=1 Tax=Ischnura elegans TaxID=197161 RepID=UPI001ED86EA8|nr:prostatic spermine-binding protein-like [Ischnura elegans]
MVGVRTEALTTTALSICKCFKVPRADQSGVSARRQHSSASGERTVRDIIQLEKEGNHDDDKIEKDRGGKDADDGDDSESDNCAPNVDDDDDSERAARDLLSDGVDEDQDQGAPDADGDDEIGRSARNVRN